MGEKRKSNVHHEMTTNPEGYAKKWHDRLASKEHRIGKYYHPSKQFSDNYDKIDWSK